MARPRYGPCRVSRNVSRIAPLPSLIAQFDVVQAGSRVFGRAAAFADGNGIIASARRFVSLDQRAVAGIVFDRHPPIGHAAAREAQTRSKMIVDGGRVIGWVRGGL